MFNIQVKPIEFNLFCYKTGIPSGKLKTKPKNNWAIMEPEHRRTDSSPLYMHFSLIIVLIILLLWLIIYKLNNQKTVSWHLYSKFCCSRTSSETKFASITRIPQSANRQKLEFHKSHWEYKWSQYFHIHYFSCNSQLKMFLKVININK